MNSWYPTIMPFLKQQPVTVHTWRLHSGERFWCKIFYEMSLRFIRLKTFFTLSRTYSFNVLWGDVSRTICWVQNFDDRWYIIQQIFWWDFNDSQLLFKYWENIIQGLSRHFRIVMDGGSLGYINYIMFIT